MFTKTDDATYGQLNPKNDSVVNTFVKMMDALEYDIELHYVKGK